MSLTNSQVAILRAIAGLNPVSAEQATWAVKEGYAIQAEDADIDLTPAGHEVLEGGGRA
ncbi:hypothetical protein [Stenotrophomonas maltophilia]|uniref:hypothetical protein n=1 Tax=Stenotrophomonas maltophilia TaxID=40324 RepID=UPI002E76315D|nr:hypothetical protein [Stenotrophomonas maltophilia]